MLRSEFGLVFDNKSGRGFLVGRLAAAVAVCSYLVDFVSVAGCGRGRTMATSVALLVSGTS